jgi:O-antigen/teichoic acid export membrane protein
MSVRTNIIANFIGNAWVALMGFVFVPVYVRYLGVEAWGLVGFMSMLQAWLTLLDLGLSPTLSREMALFQGGGYSPQSIRDLLRSLELIYGAVALTVVGLVWLIAPWIAQHWLHANRISEEIISQAIGIMGLVLASRMVEQVYRGAIQGLQRQVWLNGVQCVLALVRWGGAVAVLQWWSSSINAFFLWQGIVSLMTLVILARKTYASLPIGSRSARFDVERIIQIKQFAGGMAITTLLSLLLTQVDKILLSKLVSLEDFGYYTIAGTLAGALYFSITPVATAISPHLTKLIGNAELGPVIAVYHRASQLMAILIVPTALVIAAFSDSVIYVWTGDHDLARKVGPILSLLTIGTLFNGFMHVPYVTQLAHGWTGLTIRMNMVAVCISIPGIIWAVPRLGAIGAAWSWVAVNVSYVVVGITLMHSRILPNEKWEWYRRSVLTPLGVGLIIVIFMRQAISLPQSRLDVGLFLLIGSLFIMAGIICVTPIFRREIQKHINAVLKIFLA